MPFSDDSARPNRFRHPDQDLARGDDNPPPTEVQCALDGHHLPPRHTFTAVGYPTLSGEVLEYSPDPRTETWTGLNGTLRLEDGTIIPVRDGTLTINYKD